MKELVKITNELPSNIISDVKDAYLSAISDGFLKMSKEDIIRGEWIDYVDVSTMQVMNDLSNRYKVDLMDLFKSCLVEL